MVNEKSDSLFSVELPDGTTLDYPAKFTARYVSTNPVEIKMLPLSLGVEEQAFLLVGELMDEIPILEDIVDALLAGQIKNLKERLNPADLVRMVRAAVVKAPRILTRFAAAVCELDEDGVKKKLTLAETVEMITPVIFLEQYRFNTSFGSILERLGFDLDEVDAEEEVLDLAAEDVDD